MQLLRDNLVSAWIHLELECSSAWNWANAILSQTLWTSSEAEPAAVETNAAPAEAKEAEAAPTETKADAE